MTLSVKKIPKDWDNHERLNHLFNPFRNRVLNPTGYDCKMVFWKSLIDSSLSDCNCCSFTLDELETAFYYQKRKPLCLKEVIDDMISKNEINNQSSFEALVPSGDTWANWAVNRLIFTPLNWSMNKLKESVYAPTETSYEGRFISLALVKKKANDLLGKLSDNLRDKLLPLEEVHDISKDIIIERDLMIIIHWLELEGLAAVTQLGDKKLVKFAKSGQKIEQITNADTAVFSLQQNEQQLVKKIEDLELQKQAITQEAKDYLKKGMRPMAKSCLRRKKELEKQINKHITTLDNIHVLLARIHDTDSNSKIYETYKVSISALKTQLKEAGLSEDSVCDTMAQVQEVLDIHEDIQSALGETVTSPTVCDEDYETELEELLRNKENQKDTELLDETILDLPEPPMNLPTSVKSPTKSVKNLREALS